MSVSMASAKYGAGHSAWYFWLKEAPGVYHLELSDAGCESWDNELFYKALFTIKCYPHRDLQYFESFSSLEQQLILSPFFDDTNTPVFENREKIPSDLFNVAMLKIIMNHDGQKAVHSLETLDTLRSRYIKETDQCFPGLNFHRKFATGQIDRCVPGLTVAYPLVDCLLCLYANTFKQGPCQIQCQQTVGFEININDNEVDGPFCRDIKGYQVNVAFGSTLDGFITEQVSFCGNSPEPMEKKIFNSVFPCGLYDAHLTEKFPIFIDSKWWTMANAQYNSELASSCGCH